MTGSQTEPLAARMRPRSIDEVVGQEHILGEGKLLRRVIEADRLTNIILYGPPGCGKTTLLKQIAETLLPRRDINAAYMPQSYDDMLDPSLFPVEYLAPNGDKDSVTRARIYLGSMKYTTDEMSHKISELSGGQRAKLLLLNMILNDANVLILDEPTRNFSPLSAPAVRELLANFPGAIISASHDRRYIGAIATAVYELTQNGLRRIDFSL